MPDGVSPRPLGIGDIVDRVFSIYRSRPLLFLAVSAIPHLLLVVFVGAMALVFIDSFQDLAPLLAGDLDSLRAVAPAFGTLVGFILPVVAVALLASLVQSAALVDAAGARYLGRDATVGGALGVGLRAAGRLFVMGVVAFLAFTALWIASVIVMGLGGEWWIALIVLCVALFATFYMAASWMLSPAVATLEGIGPVASLRRSWALANGHRWRIFGLMALLVILQVVLSALISILVALVAADEDIQLVAQQAVSLLVTIAWAPVYWGTFAVLYYDLRVRKEAFDLQPAVEVNGRARDR